MNEGETNFHPYPPASMIQIWPPNGHWIHPEWPTPQQLTKTLRRTNTLILKWIRIPLWFVWESWVTSWPPELNPLQLMKHTAPSPSPTWCCLWHPEVLLLASSSSPPSSCAMQLTNLPNQACGCVPAWKSTDPNYPCHMKANTNRHPPSAPMRNDKHTRKLGVGMQLCLMCLFWLQVTTSWRSLRMNRWTNVCQTSSAWLPSWVRLPRLSLCPERQHTHTPTPTHQCTHTVLSRVLSVWRSVYPRSLLLFSPCMWAGRDLAWGAIVQSLIKQQMKRP